MHCKPLGARHPRTPVKLQLEALEDRTLLSAPTENPLAIRVVASPPAVSSVSTITSYVFSLVEQRMQLLDSIVQYASNVLNTLGQELIEEVAALEQQGSQPLGTHSSPPNPSPTTAVSQPSSDSSTVPGNASGSGSGRGSVTTALNTSNQPLQPITPQAGSGTGSGTSGTANQNAIPQAAIKVQPMTASGSGSSGSGSSGSGGSGSNPAPVTITGTVWLDSNGDGYRDPKELGFPGTAAEPTDVDLYNGAAVLLERTRPVIDGSFKFIYTPPPGNGPAEYQVVVAIQQYYEATIPDRDSLIDSSGYYLPVDLAPGQSWNVGPAGLRSMHVNTADDDPIYPIQNMTTLRDAIETGNNGPPEPAVTFAATMSGVISLKSALDPIAKSYDISGPGNKTLTVLGNGDAGNPYRIFTVNAGVTSTISGLTIQGGFDVSGSGGGILNDGNLTLDGDIVQGNQTPLGKGGGVCNDSGASLTLSGDITISGNRASYGGGLYNIGNLKMLGGGITNNTVSVNGGGIVAAAGQLTLTNVNISNNEATNGGGIFMGKGTAKVTGGTISSNSALNRGKGGGIYVYGGILLLKNNVFIYKNSSTAGDGGGMAVVGGSASMSSGKFLNCNAWNNGGAIWTTGGILTLLAV